MNIPFVDLKAQYRSIKSEIDETLQSILDNTSFIGGPIVKDFESNFAEYVGANHCVACANGTDAIEIALQAMGVGAGDEVIVPAMSWMSTSEAVSTVGAKSVFVDVLDGYYTIDPNKIKDKITSKTKVIIPVHFYGRAAQMNEIMTVAKEHGLKVLEDSAQAHGARYQGKGIATFGDIATFSFYPGKNLGAYGDAGAIVTNNEELATKSRMIGNHGQLSKHNHQMEGRNSRMDTLQAAVLKVKLKYIHQWTEARISHARRYHEKLQGIERVRLPVLDQDKHVFHVFAIQVADRDVVKEKLQENGISTQVHYPNALPALPPYVDNENLDEYPVACALAKNGLSLPMYPELTEEQIGYVCKTLWDSIK